MYHCTIDLVFDWFGISCMTIDIFCFYLQNREIQTSRTGGQQYSDTSPFSIPWYRHHLWRLSIDFSNMFIAKATGLMWFKAYWVCQEVLVTWLHRRYGVGAGCWNTRVGWWVGWNQTGRQIMSVRALLPHLLRPQFTWKQGDQIKRFFVN